MGNFDFENIEILYAMKHSDNNNNNDDNKEIKHFFMTKEGRDAYIKANEQLNKKLNRCIIPYEVNIKDNNVIKMLLKYLMEATSNNMAIGKETDTYFHNY